MARFVDEPSFDMMELGLSKTPAIRSCKTASFETPPHPGNPPVPGPVAVPDGFEYEVTPRREYTDKLVAVEPPSIAKPAWRDLVNILRELFLALANHEAMADNINRPFGEPAKRKTKVYHTWDFVGRTLSMVLAVDPTLPRRLKGQWNEVHGRAKYSKTLIMDTTGMMDRMAPDDYGTGVEFGEEVLGVARRIT
ncbi:uncharacterized protein KY384_000405 [Bacidia gigantensis]|uniref:uncharacterized protein n=1 Tax=Bacidia gigantensis TaxID=2732470 RepID=UPI001D038694|nr:uncharacterized protein KY384_000405 [Bacidia gigantensis]KAG8525645.1 hypothetical protein KY384_000405 [Bacidia gigantensis]